MTDDEAALVPRAPRVTLPTRGERSPSGLRVRNKRCPYRREVILVPGDGGDGGKRRRDDG